MKNHIYVIPTNRLCIDSIKSLLEEVILIENNPEIDLDVILIDGSKKEYSAKNQKIFNYIATKLKKSKAYFLTTEYVDKIITEAVNYIYPNNEREEILQLLVGDKYSYGMAANRTFLIAAGLKADYLHRRDSDVLLQYKNEINILSPLEIEIKYLGEKASILSGEISENHTDFHEKPIYMVGGGYKGNWGIDYEDLAEKNIDALYRLFHISKPSMSYTEIKDYTNKKYIYGSKEIYNKDLLSFKLNNLIDVGNFSLYKVFNYLPVSPAVKTSGTDYFYHSILSKLNLPELYHNRRVIHKYDDNRYVDMKLNNYHIFKAKSRCSKQFYSLLYKDIEKSNNKYFENGIFNSKAVASYLINLSQNQMLEEQENVINIMTDTYISTNLDKYIKIAKYIQSQKPKIITKTSHDIYDHGFLTLKWPKLINYMRDNFKIDKVKML